MTHGRARAGLEREHHRQAFELYSSLPRPRSYREVAEQLGVSVGTIKNWAKRFRWQERLRILQCLQTKQVTEQAAQSVREQSARQLKLLDAGIAKLARLLAEGKLGATSADLVRLAKLKERLEQVERLRQELREAQRNRVFAILPKKDPLPGADTGGAYLTGSETQDEYGRPIIPKSQLDEYLEMLRRGGN